MDATRATTIDDLPDDMLYEIFGHAFEGEVNVHKVNGHPVAYVHAASQPEYTHGILRSVCRRWTKIADGKRLSIGEVVLAPCALADAATVRFKPASIKKLSVFDYVTIDDDDGVHFEIEHTVGAPAALASLVAGGAILTRSLQSLKVAVCCAVSLAPTIAPIAACTALTKLKLEWYNHAAGVQLSADALAPLSSLVSLKELTMDYDGDAKYFHALPAWPTMPETSRLTCLDLKSCTNFVPVGSAAALARLRRLDLTQKLPGHVACQAADPLLLRAAFDAGVWQPTRLQGLRQLHVSVNFHSYPEMDPVVVFAARRSPVGAEWAPLAAQVTDLHIMGLSPDSNRPDLATGLVAGLGALTGLRSLHIESHVKDPLIDTNRLRAPHLTNFYVDGAVQPLDLTMFPMLVHVFARAFSRAHTPLDLRSLAGRHRLQHLTIGRRYWQFESVSMSTNLAELFHGGSSLPALKTLRIQGLKLTWDTTDLVDVPTAEEFAARARQLLPSLVDVAIEGAEPEAAGLHLAEAACRQHVVPALRALAAGVRA